MSQRVPARTISAKEKSTNKKLPVALARSGVLSILTVRGIFLDLSGLGTVRYVGPVGLEKSGFFEIYVMVSARCLLREKLVQKKIRDLQPGLGSKAANPEK